jgi:hypothetical protein
MLVQPFLKNIVSIFYEKYWSNFLKIFHSILNIVTFNFFLKNHECKN